MYVAVLFSAHAFTANACRTPHEITVTSERELLVSDAMFQSGCIRPHQPWLIRVSDGQRLNISLLDLQHGASDDATKTLGKLIDVTSGREQQFDGSLHERTVLVSSGSTVEVTLYDMTSRFALDVQGI